MPITNIDQRGITTYINNQKIIFEFITGPQTKIINEVKNLLINKKKQLCFLKEEIKILNIEEHLSKDDIKRQIRSLEKQFQIEICNDVPNAFWDMIIYYFALMMILI